MQNGPGVKTPTSKTPVKSIGHAPKDRPSISLCMMVKDEEKRLPTALASAAPYVDEIIVVDTGSTDRTVEIAESYGAQVYHHPWQNSFSYHRNQTIEYANGDWLLILDADEELDQETAPQMHDLVKNEKIDCYLFKLFNISLAGGEGFVMHPRLFRAGIGFHYDGEVHNKPVVPGTATDCKVVLYHYGYAESPEVMEKKHQRRKEMIGAWVKREPEDFFARAYLAQALISRKEDLDQGLEEGLIALELVKKAAPGPMHFPRVYWPIMFAYNEKCMDEELQAMCHECLSIVSTYGDPHFFLTISYYRQRKWQETYNSAKNFLEAQVRTIEHPEEHIFIENQTFTHYGYVLMRQAVAAGHLGNEDETLEISSKLSIDNNPEQHAKNLLKELMNDGLYELGIKVADHLQKQYDQWPWIPVLRNLCEQALEKEMLENITKKIATARQEGDLDKTMKLMEKVAYHTPRDARPMLELARDLIQAGREDDAIIWFTRGLNSFPGRADDWKSLADCYFSKHQHGPAKVLYEKALAMEPGNKGAASRLKATVRRLERGEKRPMLQERPPKLAIFLVDGLTPEMVLTGAPHLLMHTAWGELTSPSADKEAIPSAWADLYCAATPEEHDLNIHTMWGHTPLAASLKARTMWDVISQHHSLGMAAAPLYSTPVDINGWCLAGFPAGLLSPDLARPQELSATALARGYRSDFCMNALEGATVSHFLGQNIVEEAMLMQVERNKLVTVARMPAVDVLTVGFTALARYQATFGLQQHRTFMAYQNIYSMLEVFIQSLGLEHFAILSPGGYDRQMVKESGPGFYCLSWLNGENQTTDIKDIAPAILEFLGIDPIEMKNS